MKRGMRLLVAFLLIFVTVFADVRFVKAAPSTGTAKIYRIYAEMTQNEWGEEVPDFDNAVIAEEAPEGKILVAKYITDGTYVPKLGAEDHTDAEISLFLNNVTIDLSGTGEDRIKRFWDWRLAGDSKVIIDNMTVSTTDGDDLEELDVFPAVTGKVTIDKLRDVFGPYPYNVIKEQGQIIKYPKEPRYDVTGNHMVEGEIFAGRIVIDKGATLHMKDYEAENGGTNGGVIEATVVEANGTIQLDAPSNDWAPAQIRVYADGSLSLGSNGKIEAADGSELILHDRATCNDAAKALLYKNDGDSVVPFDLDANHEKIKFVFENGKWIYQEPAFGVDYDEWWRWDEDLDCDVATASVSVNGIALSSGERMPFNANEELTVNFVMPEERTGCEPSIVIESEEWWMSTWGEGESKLVVTDNSFTITPPNGDEFWIRFWWSDYDSFHADEDEFLVETGGDGGTVSADLTNATIINTMDEPNGIGGKKTTVKRDTLNDSVTFTFTPEENRRLCNVDIWLDNHNERYSLRVDNNDPEQKPINSANGFSEADGVYTFTYDLSGYENNWISVHAYFEDTQYNWIKENKYFLDYDPWGHWDDEQQKDVYTAFVKKDGAVIDRHDDGDDSTLYDYTIGDTYSFSLNGPEERNGCTPVVDIETGLGEFYSSDANRADDSHRITLTNNSFSFTPKDKYGFVIRVLWSEYDCFNSEGEEEFLVETNGDNGTVTADLSNVTIIRSMNEPNGRAGKKYIINRSEIGTKLNNKIKFTFTPNKNSRLSGVDFWLDRREDEKRFTLRKDDDPNRELISEENGFTEENGVYTYTFNLSGCDTGHITASAWFEDTQYLWIAENEYRIRYNEMGAPEDELPGRVFVNNVYVSSCDDENEKLNYTVGEAINFKLELPFNRTDCTPIVELNTERGEYYSSKQENVDSSHYIKLNSDNTFSFTPTDKYGFDIWINWSDFDAFWYDDRTEFIVAADHYFDGSVSITQEPKDSFDGGREDIGVKYLFDNSALEGEDIRIKMTPNEDFYVASVWLRVNRPDDYFDSFYVSCEPGGDDRYMFEEGSGFSQEGDIVYYTIPKDVAGAFIIMSIEYREKQEDMKVYGKGRKVEYRVDNASTYTALPDDSDTIPKEVFENADEIKIRFSDLNGDESGVRVIINDYYQYSWLNPLQSDGTYTIRKSDIGGWKGIEIELIDWRTPMNGQYMVQWFGAEDDMSSSNGLVRDTIYNIPDNGPIELKFTEPIYRVIVEPDWSERFKLDPDGNSHDQSFSYTPEDTRALIFKVYPTEGEYNYFENINPNHEQEQFSAEYDINIHLDENNNVIPGLGGTVTYNVETIDVGGLKETVKQHHFVRNKYKLILQGGEEGITSITLTITPNIGCDYNIFARNEDITEQVKANGNKYVWDVSEPWNISWIFVDFHQGNTPLSGTVTVNGTAKYGEELTVAVTGEVNEEAIKYQWYRGDTAIEGATEATYTTVKEDISKVVSCEVTSTLQSGRLSGATGTAIAKADGPEAPTGLKGVAATKAGQADGKITGVSVLMEYATKADFSDKKGCEGTEITGLKAGTYYVRLKESDVHLAGEKATVTVNDGKANISGTVSISGTAKFGQKLTAKVSGSNATEFTYQWKRGNDDIDGAIASTYTLVKEDIGQIISCVVSDKKEDTLGNISGKISSKVEKADGPAAPTGVKGTACTEKGSSDGQITGASSLMEYAAKADFSDKKKCDETITGLAAGTYYVRIAETDTTKAGASAEIVVEDGPDAQKTQEELVSDFVKRFYTIILQRDQVNDVEIEYYTSRLLSHEIDGCTVARGFVMSPEYTGKGEDNLTFVNKMYAAFFNREADDAAFYVNLLEAGHSREVVLAGFVNSPEFKNLCAEYGINPGELVVEPENNNPENNQGNQGNQGENPSEDITKLNLDSTNVDPEKLDNYVQNLYLQILGRGYDDGGLQYWKEQIMAGTTYDAATAARVGFFESPEYQEKNKTNEEFVIDCYHAFLGRDPEPEGLAYWTEKLDSGEYSKQKVIDLGFGHSEEFKNILRDCGFGIIE